VIDGVFGARVKRGRLRCGRGLRRRVGGQAVSIRGRVSAHATLARGGVENSWVSVFLGMVIGIGETLEVMSRPALRRGRRSGGRPGCRQPRNGLCSEGGAVASGRACRRTPALEWCRTLLRLSSRRVPGPVAIFGEVSAVSVDVDAGFSTLFGQTVMTSTGPMGAPGSSLMDEPPACAVEVGCGTAMPAVFGPTPTPRSTVSYARQTRADPVTVRAGRPDVLPSPLRRHWAGAQCAARPLTCPIRAATGSPR
jgi:hypothetical protein